MQIMLSGGAGQSSLRPSAQVTAGEELVDERRSGGEWRLIGRDAQLGTGEARATRVRSRLRTTTSLVESVPMCRVRPSRLRNSTSTPSGGSSSTTVPTSPARISGSPEPSSKATMSSGASRRAVVTSFVRLQVGMSENLAGDQAGHAFGVRLHPAPQLAEAARVAEHVDSVHQSGATVSPV